MNDHCAQEMREDPSESRCTHSLPRPICPITATQTPQELTKKRHTVQPQPTSASKVPATLSTLAPRVLAETRLSDELIGTETQEWRREDLPREQRESSARRSFSYVSNLDLDVACPEDSEAPWRKATAESRKSLCFNLELFFYNQKSGLPEKWS